MIKFSEFAGLPVIEIVALVEDDDFYRLAEGIWISGRYAGNIRVDRDTHFSDASEKNLHAHVYGRSDRDNALVAVRKNGMSSHGLKGRLHKKDADALRSRGFDIPSDNIIEFVALGQPDAQILNESLLQ